MKTRILIITMLLTLPFAAQANKQGKNNYDDIAGYFTIASQSESPHVNYFYTLLSTKKVDN